MTNSLMVVLTGIIAAATVAYVVVTGLLWWTTKKSADAAKESAEAATAAVAQMRNTADKQLRAYVCVSSALLKFPQPDIPEGQVHFKNCGQTPAYTLQGWIHTWFSEHPLKEVLPTAPDDFRKGSETLPPGGTTIFVAPGKPPLPPLNLAVLGRKEFTLYIYGEVRYRDIFGRDQFTRFRLIHGGAEGTRNVLGKDGSEQWLLKPDAEGNEAS
jgi:hypothetical protein